MKKYAIHWLLLLLTICLFKPTLVPAHESVESSTGGGEKGILFIAMGPSNNYAMVDITTEKVMKAVAGPVNPHGIAVTPDGKLAYLTSRNPGKETNSSPADFPVTVFDVATGALVARVDVGGESHHAWMNPDSTQVYVTVPSVEGIVVIETRTNTVVKTIETGYKANSTVTSPDGTMIYVLNKGDDSLSAINKETLKVTKTVDTGKGPDHMAISPDGKYIYITAAVDNALNAVRTDTLEVVSSMPVGKGPHGIAVSSDGMKVFASNRGEGTFSEYLAPDLKKVRTINPGTGPGHVSVAPGGKHVYINDEAEAKTYIYDPDVGKVIHTIYLWPEPHEMTFYIPDR
jgi:YVTN family beta-propeller protein